MLRVLSTTEALEISSCACATWNSAEWLTHAGHLKSTMASIPQWPPQQNAQKWNRAVLNLHFCRSFNHKA